MGGLRRRGSGIVTTKEGDIDTKVPGWVEDFSIGQVGVRSGRGSMGVFFTLFGSG